MQQFVSPFNATQQAGDIRDAIGAPFWRDDVAAVLADTDLVYSGSGTVVSAGDYVQTKAEGFSYEVAASGASDHHLTTAGGVKLYVRPILAGASGGIFVSSAFDIVADGSDEGAKLQSMLTAAAGHTAHISDGTIGTAQEITIPANTRIIGAGKTVSTIKALSGLAAANIFKGNGVDNISIEDLGLEGNNDTVTPDFSNSQEENLMFFLSCSNVRISRCALDKAPFRAITFEGAVGDVCNQVLVEDCEITNGSRGGIFVARYGSNVTIRRNTLTNSVNSAVGGLDYEKSISVSGTETAYIYENVVRQTNTDAASIIVEYADRASKNIHIYQNDIEFSSATADNNIKAGAVETLRVWGNRCKGAYASSVYIEGCYDYDIYLNDLIEAGDSAVIILSDTSPTSRGPLRGRVAKNKITDANQNGNTLGTVGAAGFASTSFAIFINSTTDGLDIEQNTFLDTGENFNGIQINASDYTLTGNDMRGMHSNRVTIDNHFSSAATPYMIRDNKGAQTTDQGRATLTNTNSSVSITPDILAQYNPHVVATLEEALSGTAVYFICAPDTPPGFAFQTKTSAHAAAAVTADVDFMWFADNSQSVHGWFGKTTR